MVDGRGAPIDVLGPEDLAAADERMKSVVPALPIAVAETRDALSVLTGGTAKYLRLSFGKDVVTRGDLEDLRLRVAAQPSGPLRNEVLIRDAGGNASTSASRSSSVSPPRPARARPTTRNSPPN